MIRQAQMGTDGPPWHEGPFKLQLRGIESPLCGRPFMASAHSARLIGCLGHYAVTNSTAHLF